MSKNNNATVNDSDRTVHGNEYRAQFFRRAGSRRAPVSERIVICLAAILMDPLQAFAVGGIGAFIGDFLLPCANVCFTCYHGLQAVVISVFSHRILKTSRALHRNRMSSALSSWSSVFAGKSFRLQHAGICLAEIAFQVLQAVSAPSLACCCAGNSGSINCMPG